MNRRREVLLALFFLVVPVALLEVAARLILPPPPANAGAGLGANQVEDNVRRSTRPARAHEGSR